MEALQVEKLTKDFGGVRAVHDVNLSVEAGERRAIIGANGAGKSTLIKLITGEIPPTYGRVSRFGLVAFAQGGVGAIMGVGQGIAGLAVIGQVGVGLFFFLGQVGFGAQAIGQGVAVGREGGWFSEMNAELHEVLRPPWKRIRRGG